ncbi:hypothetical protein [Amycolatopsis keratiniphila]|uniref:Uncharacterized protein n=1 Tax=Amycolatopsis keratiniphila TaxID=129921 RepID=R4SUT0_9PSEU|nr:hypothetical protein [Amycolatopsis keratiniphila]AGM07134.1 hypothetical protein AORI_4550 [Amycolatopsis keratiniphila]
MDAWTTVDWFAVPGPAWYRPEAAAGAVQDLAVAVSADGAALAVGRLVDAVGNDHRGTLYPAAAPAVNVLLKVIHNLPGKPRIEALGVLLDWWGCFAPEPGYTLQDDDGRPVEVTEAVEREIRDAADVLRTVAGDWSDGSPARKMAKDLLALLDAGSWSDLAANR